MCQIAKNRNHTEILKIRIRLTHRRKPRKPDTLIPIRCPALLAITVNTTATANEISHAGK